MPTRQRSRVLSNRIEAIEYVHARDGKRYRHDFERADSAITLGRDGSVTVRNPRRRLWGLYDGKPFLENPPMATSRKRRPIPKGYRSWKAYMASIRPNGPKRRKSPKSKPSSPRRRKAPSRNPSRGAVPVAKARKTSSRRRRRNPVSANPRRSRRRYRRNPPGGAFSVRNIVNTTIDGALNGLYIVGGKAISRLGRQQLGYPPGSVVGSAVEAAASVAAGLLAQRFLGTDAARFVTAGGISASIEAVIKSANLPYVSAALGDAGDFDSMAAYPSAGGTALPGDGEYTPEGALGAYPSDDPRAQLGGGYNPLFMMT